eukprot:GHRQ01031750.1.p1 GENE.GHRQ01031750.1~~GHRQ01031750.1.p1  ORF type:complete len:174 (-),score=14.56 GHRQ01031750.1:200-721(-)
MYAGGLARLLGRPRWQSGSGARRSCSRAVRCVAAFAAPGPQQSTAMWGIMLSTEHKGSRRSPAFGIHSACGQLCDDVLPSYSAHCQVLVAVCCQMLNHHIDDVVADLQASAANRKKAVRSNWSIGMNKALAQNVSHEKVRLFGEAFAKIQEATGAQNAELPTAYLSSSQHAML